MGPAVQPPARSDPAPANGRPYLAVCSSHSHRPWLCFVPLMDDGALIFVGLSETQTHLVSYLCHGTYRSKITRVSVTQAHTNPQSSRLSVQQAHECNLLSFIF